MDLYLVRHAIAEDSAPEQADAERHLTRKGSRRFAVGVEGLDRLGVRLDLLVHSPHLRAVETAELLTPLLRGESCVSAHLAQAPSQELLNELRGERVAVVGHEPWLSELLAWLSTGDPHAGRAMHLGKGAVAWLRGDARPGAMVLRALYPPSTLRTLARDE